MPRNFKYKTSFGSTDIIIPKKDKSNTSKASISALKSFFPEGYEDRPDLMPWAANVATPNRFNLNGDGISTAVALKIFKRFEMHQANLEHDPDKITGVITKAGLTKFNENFKSGDGSEVIQASDIKENEIFNIAVGGYIWSVMFPAVAEKLLECSDPDSPHYLKASVSWEVAFNDYCLAIGNQNLSECEIIKDPAKIEELFKYHVSQGGTGKTPDGKEVYRLICFSKNEDGTDDYDSVLPLGLGFTFSPAAAVAGVATPATEDEDEDEMQEMKCPECGHDKGEEEGDYMTCAKCGKKTMSSKWKQTQASGHFVNKCDCGAIINQCRCSGEKTTTVIPSGCEKCRANKQTNHKNTPKTEQNAKKDQKNENKISNLTKSSVITNTNNSMKTLKSLAELSSLNDESKAEYSFANVPNLIQAAVAEAETKAKANMADTIQSEVERISKEWKDKNDKEKSAAEAAVAEANKLKAEVETNKTELDKVAKELAALKEESEKAVAEKLFQDRMAGFDEEYELDDEERESIARNIRGLDEKGFESYAKDAKVYFKSKKKDKKGEDPKGEKAKASQVVADALDKAKKTGASVPNTPSSEQDDKYKNAFKLGEGISFSIRK